jgi:hypothetical protein
MFGIVNDIQHSKLAMSTQHLARQQLPFPLLNFKLNCKIHNSTCGRRNSYDLQYTSKCYLPLFRIEV